MQTISTISVFPEIFACLDYGIPARANRLNINMQHLKLHNYSQRKDKRIDDRPFGGQEGMVIQAEIIHSAINSLNNPDDCMIIITDPKGKTFKQQDAKRMSLHKNLIFVCARYEGIDARALHNVKHEKFSIGDFVTSGGELAAAIMIDATLREIDGIIGNKNSLLNDSFQDNLLDHQHYTRPWLWHDLTPPKILQSGNHKAISTWKNQQKLGNTWLNRPELLIGRQLSEQNIQDLNAFLKEQLTQED